MKYLSAENQSIKMYLNVCLRLSLVFCFWTNLLNLHKRCRQICAPNSTRNFRIEPELELDLELELEMKSKSKPGEERYLMSATFNVQA